MHAEPSYPPSLRAAGVQGRVTAQYEVGCDGKVDMTTFEVLASKDPAFTESVRAYLPKVQFRRRVARRRCTPGREASRG